MGRSHNMGGAPRARWRCGAAVLFVLALALAIPASAEAVRPLKTGIEGVRVIGRPDSWGLNHAVTANASIVRINTRWSAIAPRKPKNPRNPNDPAYNWNSIDPLVRGATARGMQVLLTVYSAPGWAEGKGKEKAIYPGSWKPNPRAFGDFGHALAAKYSGTSGPRVRYFETWNEPNISTYLEPVWNRKHGKVTPASPQRFVAMANRFYAGVKSVHKSNRLIGPSSSPYGDPKKGPYAFGAPRMRPLYFLRRVVCLTKKHRKLKPRRKHCTSAKFDIVSQHPIDRVRTHGPTYHATNPDDVGPGDMGRIKRTMRTAERLHTVSKHPRHRPLWVTEFWRGSNPPDPHGVPLSVQAKWIEQGFYEFWKAGVSVAIYQGLVDNDGVGSNTPVGLFFANFAPKPAWTAFRFPFVAHRTSKREVKVWGKAPASGILRIERSVLGGWSRIKTISVHRNETFQTTLPIKGKVTLRGQVGLITSLPWNQN